MGESTSFANFSVAGKNQLANKNHKPLSCSVRDVCIADIYPNEGLRLPFEDIFKNFIFGIEEYSFQNTT
jgi:hypothetical protein